MIKMFIDKNNVNFNSEALKMNNYLLKKFFKGNKLKEAHKSQISNLENEEKIELRRLFYKVYSNNLAIPNTDCYFYQNMNVYPSNSSIDPQDEFVVFEYLSQGNKKVFMKNVTIIEKEWVV
ncbi:pre-mRNA splicing factor [Nosema bombycis CQ1]|uniref:Pre-mRNA splicing factor n=1 Tax=Nosema bombycis (strain CQ1 / CVCC 102059) TaxID=578461 RepID=R0MMC9_NOSB1|nr:pre-mRNA splicing factor [Nosema bombycis CQ1]|eukprot:EOB14003.1 pre-mRNA splicing factor [Nosema bombycis CQ1]